jgi:hypothetical protein
VANTCHRAGNEEEGRYVELESEAMLRCAHHALPSTRDCLFQ